MPAAESLVSMGVRMLLVGLLPACVCVDALLGWNGIVDGQTLTLASSLMVGIVLCASPWLDWPKTQVSRWGLLAALAGTAWMALGSLAFPSWSRSGWLWVAGHGMACAAALTVASGRTSLAWWIPALGAGAACALALVYAGQSLGISDGHAGFGVASYLINTCGPAILAWCVWEVAAPRRRPAALTVALGAGLLLAWSALHIIPGSPRRGVLLTMAVVPAWVAASLLMQRWPALKRPLLVVLGGAALVAVIAGGVHLVTDPGLGRSERLTIYRSALEAIPRALPFGWGAHGCMAMAGQGVESAREWESQGGFAFHAHCEPLDLILTGGIPLAVAAGLLVAALVLHCAAVADRRRRLALQSLGIAAAIHLLTDPVAGIEGPLLLYGAFAGMILRSRRSPPIRLPAAPRIPVRALLIPLAIIAAWVAYREISAFSPVRGHDPLAAWQRTLRPDTALAAFRAIEASGDPAALDRACKASPPLRADSGICLVAAITVAQAAGDARSEFLAHLGILERRPTWLASYHRLSALLRQDRDLIRLAPEAVLRRIPYAIGAPSVAPPRIPGEPAIDDLDTAADLLVACYWSLAFPRQGVLDQALRPLVARYGHLPDVAALAVCAAANRPGRSVSWSDDELRRLRAGLSCGDALASELVDQALAAGHGAELWPLFSAVFPGLLDPAHGRSAPPPARFGSSLADTLAPRLTRIWGIHHQEARRAGSGGLSPAP